MRILDDVRTDRQSIRKYIYAWSYFHLIREGNDLKNYTRDEIDKKIPSAYPALFYHLYENLTILDGKSNVLVASSSIFTAALGIILSTNLPHDQKWILWSLSFVTAISLISVLLVISVVSVHWSTADELEVPHLDDLLDHLVDVRNSRTLRYRIAWWLHIGVILSSFAMLFVKLSSI